MSRCFPFPPPGYENKPASEHVDLLVKEKHKEKHKKEKKDREKKEGKDRKDKDRSKDKHKDKKDRKEKHKDKKKEKDRERDKSKTADEGKIEDRAAGHNEEKLGGRSQKAGEVKDVKYAEELGRRIRDEEKVAASRMAENTPGVLQKRNESMAAGATFASSVQRRMESMGTGTAVVSPLQKRIETNSAPKGIEPVGAASANNNTSALQRIGTAGNGTAISSLVKRIESTSTGATISGSFPKGAGSIDPGTSVGGSGEKRTENVSVGPATGSSVQKRMENMGPGTTFSASSQKRNESMGNSMALEKERGTGSRMVPNLVNIDERRNNGMGKPMDMDMEKRTDSRGNAVAMAKERVTGNRMLPTLPVKEERRKNGMVVETDAEKKIKGKEKVKDRDPDRDKDKDRGEKRSKGKDKDKHKDKQKEKDKAGEKGEHRHKSQEKIKDAGKNNLVDSINLKHVASQTDNEKNVGPDFGPDGNIKKRKDFNMNGVLCEIDVRPTKLPRPATCSQLPIENGRILEPYPLVTPNPSARNEPSVSVKAERVLDSKESKANGIMDAYTSAGMKPSSAPSTSGNGKVSKKPPHPDSKYLGVVYSVPKMDEWPEYDEQAWLFSSDNLPQKPRLKLDTEEIPPVWEEAMQIKSADVFVLPYVIPY